MLRERIRTLFPFHLALASIIVLWVYMAVGHEIGDPDLWWHLRNAEYLFGNMKLPRADMYSYTAPGQPWINHQWLAEVLYYLAWRAGGLLAVYVLFTSLLIVILLGIFYLSYKRSGNLKGSFLATCFSVLLAIVSFGPRTLLFGHLYLEILLLLLWRLRSRGRACLWVLPPLFCLWINTHGSWVSGLIVLAIAVISGLWQGSWGRVEAVRWTPGQLRQLLITGGASVAALFLNPYGYRLVLYPFDLVFHQKLNVGHVNEWASVNFHDGRGKVVLVLLAALLLGALFARCRWRLEELFLTLFALYFALAHIRFLFQAAILLAPLLATFLDFLPPYRPEIDKPLLNALIFAGILVVMVRQFPSPADLDYAVAKRFPAGALAYVKSHGLSGRVFNLYSWGGYITWNRPDMKTFIDSRADIFEYTGVFKDYLAAVNLEDSFAVLDKYQIRFVLLPSQDALAYMLAHHQDWKVDFKDNVAVLLERVGSLPGERSAPAVRGMPKTP